MNQDKYIGQLLDDRYEILDVLGVGGMAVVYKARCRRLNRMVAIKILKDEYSQDEEFRSRFHAESQAVAMLSHPNIVSVYDVSSSEDSDYIVMELIDGITLKYYMEKKGVLNWKETLHFAMQIAKALEHAHSRGIVHRDIKPHNVMVLKNGSVKVADFGIAQVMSTNNAKTQEALGSVHYISPEQAKGSRVDSRSDVYSLGIVMYEMISGRVPYDGDTPLSVVMKHINGGAQLPTTLNPNTPKGLEQIIMKAMAHQPKDRYPTATAMLYDMDEFRKDPMMVFTDTEPVSRPVPQPEITEKPQTPPTIAQKKVQPAKKSNEPINLTATIAITACVVVALVAVIILLLLLPSCQKNRNQVQVPDLVGQYFNQLQQSEYLQIERQGSEYHADYAAGQIIYQSPEAGEMVKQGSKVFVIVSLGPDVTLLEDLSGMELKEARMYLNSLGLGLSIKPIPEQNEDVEEGCVIRTEPETGAQLKRGQTVTLYYSMIQSAVVPDVIGKNIEEAKAELEDVGFSKFREKEVESDLPAGTVIELSVDVGSSVSTTKEIIIFISKGKTVMEDLTGMTLDEVSKYFEGLELKLDVQYQQETSTQVAEGCVVRTDPVAGEELEADQTVTIYYSAGAGMVVIPDLRGKTPAEVRVTLEGLGIRDIREKEISSIMTKGTVVMLSADSGVQVDASKQIVVYISKGDVGLDDLSGMTLEQATAALKELDLKLTVTEVAEDSNALAGSVLRTEPAAGSTLSYGQEVVLYYSTGVPHAVVPDVEGDSLEVAKQKLMDAGFTNLVVEEKYSDRPIGQVLEMSVSAGASMDVNTQITLQVSKGLQEKIITHDFVLPAHDTTVIVKIVCDGVVVAEKSMGPSEQTLTLKLSSSGTKQYQVYVDDVLYTTETVEFK